ncbi:unnamed protein product [Mytilus edulis]|uniref:Uncharacterized protein n=1 Tax=Mytilus edulis TaxID=6550 RepID=A0A8S3RLK0_MYTED|nr:unnamed protein product [Mytilus edulis]
MDVSPKRKETKSQSTQTTDDLQMENGEGGKSRYGFTHMMTTSYHGNPGFPVVYLTVISLIVFLIGRPHIDERPDRWSSNSSLGLLYLADNIKKFHELQLMPEGIYVCIENLDEGSGIAQSFIDHKVCWHKSCNLKLNKTKLNRAEKRTSHERIDDKAPTSKKKTRHDKLFRSVHQ